MLDDVACCLNFRFTYFNLGESVETSVPLALSVGGISAAVSLGLRALIRHMAVLVAVVASYLGKIFAEFFLLVAVGWHWVGCCWHSQHLERVAIAVVVMLLTHPAIAVVRITLITATVVTLQLQR